MGAAEKRQYDESRHKTARSAPHAAVTPRGILVAAPLECENPREGGLSYDPFQRISLPNALARVKDERSAVRFARAYGLLGYADFLNFQWQDLTLVDRRRMFDDPLLDEGQLKELLRSLDDYGDPMPWLLAQARSVRLAMELIEAIGRKEFKAVRDVVLRHTLPHVGSDQKSRPQLLVAGGPSVKWFAPGRGLLHPDMEAMRARSAAYLIEELVNPNVASLRWQLFTPAYRGPNELEIELGFEHRALFEVVWWHVANAAFGRRPGTRVRLCELETCRAPFIVTDERQRFCPADYTYTDKRTGKTRPGRSRCAALYQKRHGGQSKTEKP